MPKLRCHFMEVLYSCFADVPNLSMKIRSARGCSAVIRPGKGKSSKIPNPDQNHVFPLLHQEWIQPNNEPSQFILRKHRWKKTHRNTNPHLEVYGIRMHSVYHTLLGFEDPKSRHRDRMTAWLASWGAMREAEKPNQCSITSDPMGKGAWRKNLRSPGT